MPLAKLAIWQYVLIFAAFALEWIECKSVFGIGARIINDQLILKDVLQSRLVGVDKNPVVGFNYAIPEPITYIEIVSEQNVLADVYFSYQNDLVKGNIVAIPNDNNTNAINGFDLFEVQISIYGFNETMLNINPSYILNKDQQFQGILAPEFDYDIDENETESSNESEEMADVLDDDMEYFGDFGDADKIIEQGTRQKGDYLLYETYQTSHTSTEEPSNHTVTFYYIDSSFITYVRFIIFDHTIDRTSSEYNPPVAEYSHFSPNSLKAVIKDDYTTNLFVQMLIYGYQPDDVPADYAPYLTIRYNTETEAPSSALQRLKALMNAKSHENYGDLEEINFETGERNELSTNNTTTDASARMLLGGFTVFNVIIIQLLFF
ncbi:PREDICTED: uncharacterized protein LOC108368151 [Rhagoletis zephyria]|uniref:uncharacterized protein LOC108368151 n=1 Tax=Rhagoletis zephyria TaxID=28612 RepID=UPI000811574E|nr:PREDICTED: uncharacterized protein LOC108368151 [Rhagoletis zephyria]